MKVILYFVAVSALKNVVRSFFVYMGDMEVPIRWIEALQMTKQRAIFAYKTKNAFLWFKYNSKVN